MNTWANTVLTDQGRALMAKLTQGNSLNITRAVTGAGFVTPGLLAKQTAVTDPKQTLTFRPVTYPETGKCAITASLKNDGLGTGYTATQVGIYATDPDDGEVLLFISQATSTGSGTIIPSVAEMPGYSAEWTFTIQYGQADGVTVTVDPSNTVSWESMVEYVNKLGKRTARLTVGTSTAGWTKDNCDYLCDGTADNVEINAAIAALPADGGEIVLLDGSYNLAGKIDMKTSSTTLRGNGPATKLIRAFDGDCMISVPRGRCAVESLFIDGKKSTYTSSDNDGIVVAENSTVRDCIINDNKGDGIRLTSIRNIITGNQVKGSAQAGINVLDIHNVIGNNIALSNFDGISIQGDKNVVSGNVSRWNVNANLSLSGSRNTITGNDFSSYSDDAPKPDYTIYVMNGTRNIIENNQIGTGSVSIPIQVDPIRVTLSSSGWVGTEAPYTYTITGYDGKTVEVVEDVSMTMDQLAAIESAKIKSDPCSEENILYAFGERPTIDVPVLLIVR